MNSPRPNSGTTPPPAEFSPVAVSAPRPSPRAPAAARHPGAARPSIQLHIEELVLHGFSPHDRHRIAAGVEAELHRLLSERGLPSGKLDGLTMERMDAGEFKAAANASAGNLGTQVAMAVYRASSSGISTRP